MRLILHLAKREWWGFVDAPAGYVVLAAFPALLASFFFVTGEFFAEGEATLRNFFSLMPFTLALLGPAITMKMWSEESREGTEELLRTWPIQTHQLVLGKFFGALGLLALALFATGAVPLTVAWLGDLDWGPVIGAYAGSLLFGSVCLAIGLCFSAATRNQMVAWLASSVLLLVFNLTGLAATTTDIHPMLASALSASDLSFHFHSMGRGVIDFRDTMFFLSLTLVCLCWNGLLLEKRAKG